MTEDVLVKLSNDIAEIKKGLDNVEARLEKIESAIPIYIPRVAISQPKQKPLPKPPKLSQRTKKQMRIV